MRNLKLALIILCFSSVSLAGTGLFVDDPQFQACEQSLIPGINAYTALYVNNPQYPDYGVTWEWAIGATVRYLPFPQGNGAVSAFHVTYTRTHFNIQTSSLVGLSSNATHSPVCLHYIFSMSSPEIQKETTVKSTNSEGNRDIPYVCGSVIDPSKKTVIESIPIDGTDLTLNYSSEFNPNRGLNKNLSINLNIENIGWSHRIQVNGPLFSGEHSLLEFSGYSPNIQIPWDQSKNNSSTHPAINKGQFNISIEENVVVSWDAQIFNPSLVSSSDFQYLYKNLIDFKTGYPIRGTDNEYIEVPIYSSSVAVPTPYWIEKYQRIYNTENYKPQAWGLGGWTLSNHHFYNADSNTLFNGNGEKINYPNGAKTITLPGYGQVQVVSRYDDQEIYIFDLSGQHLETRSKILGRTLYKFNYDNQHRLLGFTDKFNKLTEIIYNSDETLAKIKAPYGQETLFTTTDQHITQVQSSIGQTYSMQYDGGNFLTEFKKPNLEMTQFSYDTEGNFISENKNTGLYQEIATTIANTLQTFTTWAQSGLKNTLTILFSNDRTITTLKNSSGQEIYNIIENIDNKTTFYSNGKTVQSVYFSDPIWGKSLQEKIQIVFYQESGHIGLEYPINETTYTYTNNEDPTTLKTVKTVVGSGAISFNNYSVLDVAQKTLQMNNDLTRLTSKIYLNDDETVRRIEPATEYPADFTYDTDGRLIKSQKGNNFETYEYDSFGF